MPATAGRVRMPANNRVHSSAALQTHGIWQSAIGYDPYAPENTKQQRGDGAGSASHSGNVANEQNAYDSFQSLLALARHSGSATDEARGACKKCGRVGHLTFQCRNFLTAVKEDVAAAASVAAQAVMSGKGKGDRHAELSESESSEEDSELSDSDQDSEMERVIAARMGKSLKKNGEKATFLGVIKGTRTAAEAGRRKVHLMKRIQIVQIQMKFEGKEGTILERRIARGHILLIVILIMMISLGDTGKRLEEAVGKMSISQKSKEQVVIKGSI